MKSPAATRPDNPQRQPGRWLPGLAVSSAVGAWVLIVFGSHVRVTESGMGCPDWPLCDGKYGPIFEFHALMEQTHRYLAAVVTVLILVTALLALRSPNRPAAVRPAVLTVAVIVVQIGLGALTVMAGNAAPTVAAHLIAGVAMLGGATVTAVCALVPARTAPDRRLAKSGPRLGPVGWVANCTVGVLVMSGSMVVNGVAEQACASFPLCPPEQPGSLVALHLVHRGIALLAGIALLTFAVHAWRRWSAIRGARALAATLAALLVATASFGIASALLFAPADLQNLHLAGAAALLAATVALATLGWLTAADCPTQGASDGPEADLPVLPQPAVR